MAGKISRRDVERLIFGEGGVRRFTQDSAVLPDVWIEYGESLDKPLDLLITPERATAPGKLALLLEEALKEEVGELAKLHAAPPTFPTNFTPEPLPALFKDPDDAEIAYNQSTVAAKLHLEQLIRVVLPMTSWWNRYIWKDYGEGKKEWAGYGEGNKFYDLLLNDDFRAWTIHVLKNPPAEDKVAPPSAPTSVPAVTPEFVWLVRVAGTLFFASRKWDEVPKQDEGDKDNKGGIFGIPEEKIYAAFVGLMTNLTKFNECTERQVIWTVSRNREATSLIFRSTLAVKADAARRVFELSCEKLRWAVLDSGIDAKHPAFRKRHPKSDKPESGTLAEVDFGQKGVNWEKNTRVLATYDFSKIRTRLARMRKEAREEERGGAPSSLDDAPAPAAPGAEHDPLLAFVSPTPPAPDALEPPGVTPTPAQQPAAPPAPESKAAKPLTADEQRKLKRMRESLLLGYNLNWEELEPELRVKHDDTYKSPKHEHGTHVAGILAGDWRVTDKGEWKIDEQEDLVGVCPDLNLFDLRVLNDDGVGDEFSVIAALQFVRHLNAHNDYRVIHGVNMSLSIRHDVANYACGSTPVCEEAERLVNNGTVVVAAAGNKGYMQYVTPEGRASEGYSSISITDPGNADGVLTVGSTHALRPHSYGVSYFSSRGPTGDGRLKPDLVAPGEKITSAVPGAKAGRKDGTSMAAPHVSGAAALLMARHPERVGRPIRIKEILCSTATDLGRERYFQGHGMVDILRALQSV